MAGLFRLHAAAAQLRRKQLELAVRANHPETPKVEVTFPDLPSQPPEQLQMSARLLVAITWGAAAASGSARLDGMRTCKLRQTTNDASRVYASSDEHAAHQNPLARSCVQWCCDVDGDRMMLKTQTHSGLWHRPMLNACGRSSVGPPAALWWIFELAA